MEIIIKASAIALVTAACTLIIKKSNPENAFLLGITGSVILISASAFMLSDIKSALDDIMLSSELTAAIFSPLIKCTVIAVTVKIVSALCRDSGQSAIASSVEFLGSAAAVYTVLPLLNSVIKTMGDLL